MQKLIEKFEKFYGKKPTVAAQAPGRLEILGNHTDYNQGFVLSCAVEQNTKFALAPVDGKHCRIKDFRDNSVREFDLGNIATAIPRDWSNYIKGVIVELEKRGIRVGAFDAGMESTVPLSAGMSSSAALETAAGFAFAEAFGIELPKADWARVGQGVENNYMGLKSGLLDQFSSIFGKKDSMILSDFRSVEVLRTVALPAGYSIVVVNSMAKHNLVDSEYNVRRQDCESAAHKLAGMYPDVRTLRDVSLEQLEVARPVLTEREYRRALHVVGECTRVMEAVWLLEANDVAGFGRLWFESHESSRVNFENSTEELDYLVRACEVGSGRPRRAPLRRRLADHDPSREERGSEEYAKRCARPLQGPHPRRCRIHHLRDRRRSERSETVTWKDKNAETRKEQEMKEVDFNAVVFKVAILLLFLLLPDSLMWLRNEEWGGIGWISFALVVLMFPVCCFFAVRKTPETEETRRFSEFLFRLFGLYRTIIALGTLPWTIKFLTCPPEEFVWQHMFPPELGWYVLHLLFAVTLLVLPNLWNRLIVLVGRLLRRY